MNSVASVAILILVIIGVFVLFRWLQEKEIQKRKQQSEEWERERLSEENVLKAKVDFEKRLDENADQADGIVWRQAYI